MTEPNYFAVRRHRTEVPDRFLGYPLITDRDGWIAHRILTSAERVLDIGAGDRPFEPVLRERGFSGIAKTMDVDRALACDYYSLDDIHDTFGAVLMREVIEHLPRPLLYSYLERIFNLLLPGGTLIVTTPNPWAVTWVLADYTHISPWPPADLYGVLRCYGFLPIEIHRIVWPSRFMWLKQVYWNFHSRCYDIDFAGSYLAAATRPI
jgi:SAM-dependent methyltransferase